MSELEQECIKLGIPVKTRHNEVAPSQFEIAPKYQEANLSVDHNLLLMDLMEKIADKHQFKVLFHDKPFKDLSGSGKHNNWSLLTDTGTNLLSPGSTPTKNLQFLTFFINTIKAVDTYEEVIRASLSSYSNDLRLGDQGAPSKIFSVFVGAQLASVLDDLEGVSTGKLSPEEKTELKLNVVGKIPEILMDNTDRNRTSPFAFTGNKFEIRGVGAKANCAQAMTVLNSVVAHQLKTFKKEVDQLIDKKGLKKDEAIFNVLREYIKTSKRIRFDGDSYSDQWLKEAAKRKLLSFKNNVEALEVYSDKKVVDLFEALKVFTSTELRARKEVALKSYTLNAQIEAKVLIELVNTQIIPATLSYLGDLSSSVLKINEALSVTKSNYSLEMLSELNDQLSGLKSLNDELMSVLDTSEGLDSIEEKARYSCESIVPLMKELRLKADSLELVVADQLWPITKYRELLYIK
jgi:glutamine synthetase